MRPHALGFGALGLVRTRVTTRVASSWAVPLAESAAIVCVALALARPQEVTRETIRETPGLDILLAVDTSGSMDQGDMGRSGTVLSRLEASKMVMARFVRERPDDRIGLLLFGEEAFVQVPLTLDHDALAEFIGQVGIGMAGENATAVGTAVAVAVKRMKELDAPSKIVVLITDGQSNAGSVTPLQAAQAAAALGVRVYTIGVGGGGGRGLLGLLGGGGNDVDEPTLRAVASTTGGKYFRAVDAAALAQVYTEIDALETSTGRTKEFVHRDERYVLFLVPAMIAWFAGFALAQGWLRRLP
jgi:Ca-activated chloride channel family protein